MAAAEIMQLRNLIIVQNKIDLTGERRVLLGVMRFAIQPLQARDHYNQVKTFVDGTIASHAPVIPISAQFKCNIEVYNCVLGGAVA